MDIEKLRENAVAQGETAVTKVLGYLLLSLSIGALVTMTMAETWQPLMKLTNFQNFLISCLVGITLLVVSHRSHTKLRREQRERELAWSIMTEPQVVETLISIYWTYLTRRNHPTNDFGRRLQQALQNAVAQSKTGHR